MLLYLCETGHFSVIFNKLYSQLLNFQIDSLIHSIEFNVYSSDITYLIIFRSYCQHGTGATDFQIKYVLYSCTYRVGIYLFGTLHIY